VADSAPGLHENAGPPERHRAPKECAAGPRPLAIHCPCKIPGNGDAYLRPCRLPRLEQILPQMSSGWFFRASETRFLLHHHAAGSGSAPSTRALPGATTP